VKHADANDDEHADEGVVGVVEVEVGVVEVGSISIGL
jgi:hypothetical protein